MNKQKIYFPNLNGLRFIAAFLVIVSHIELIKLFIGIDNYWETVPFIGIIGHLGVVLFFVLSGFLITYLLLSEEQLSKKISIRKFYMRRILRIWPLYFLIIILAFFILPDIDLFAVPGLDKEVVHSNLSLKLILYVLFLPNLVRSLFGICSFASHTWSIGVEEQFYLVWPVILRYAKKYRALWMFVIIILYLSGKFFLYTSWDAFIPYQNEVATFWYFSPFSCMAVGGVYAVLLFQKSKFLKYVLRSDLFYFSICTVTLLIIKGVYIPYIHEELYSILFGIIILNFSSNNKIKISLENNVLNYLGKISYGLYIYHPIAIVLAIAIGSSIDLTSNWFLYPVTLVITIIISGLSYKYFESYFLRLKHRFSKIISGNSNSE